MSGRGVFAVDRGIFDHPTFAAEPFTEREAWIWLIKEAAWKPRTVRVGRAVIALERGQCAATTRFMAQRWKWSPSRVQRFLDRLANDGMVSTLTDALATRITICKYDEYQRVSLPDGTLSDTLAGHSRYKPEDITKNIEDKNNASGADAPGENVIEFSASAKKYEFEGAVVKATSRTMLEFRQKFPHIRDLAGTLDVIDAYYTHEKPLDDPSKWYFPALRWLQKENLKARDERREATRGDEWW